MRVLIVGTVRHGHEKLRELGHEVTLFMKRSDFASKPQIADEDLAFPYDSVHLFSSKAGIEEYVDLARAIHQHRKFDAVCCLHDGMMQNVALGVSQALGLSYPITEASFTTAYNKNATRKKLREVGLDPTRFALVGSADELPAALELTGFPAIIKPLDSTGSSGVTRVDSMDGVQAAVAKLLRLGHHYPIQVEEFLQGEELSVEAISENGQHVVLAVTKKFIDENFVECGHIVPAPLTPNANAEVVQFVKSVLSALEISNGPSHTEVMLTANGPRLIETHTRPGGDRIFQLVHLATGNDLMQLTIRQFLGESVLDQLQTTPPKQSAAIWFASLACAPGSILSNVSGLACAQAVSGVQEVKILKDIGENMGSVSNSFQRTALAVAVGADAESALSNAQQAIAKLTISTEWRQSLKTA